MKFRTTTQTLSLALLLIVTAGCASVQPQTTTATNTVAPWTPTRQGHHPAELGEPSSKEAALRTSPPRSPLAQGPLQATTFLAWRLYSNTLSRSMGETCRFSPSCSRFAVDALATGPEGLILTFARLQRNHIEEHFYHVDAQGFLLDRPQDYFFWRSEAGLDAHLTGLPRAHSWYVLVNAREKK